MQLPEVSVKAAKRWLRANRREGIPWPIVIALGFVGFWFFGVVISPFLAPAGTIYLGNEGLVGVNDNADKIDQIHSGFARFFYRAGDANCHQHANRSFFLNDNQMPFCARDVAIFFGLMLGVALMVFLDLEMDIFWLLLGLVPIGLDGGIQLLTDYESTNLLRFITGTLAGTVTGIALAYIISEFGQVSVRRGGLRKPR